MPVNGVFVGNQHDHEFKPELAEFLVHLEEANEEQRLRRDEEWRRRDEESRRLDERLDAVILLVERYLSKRDNN